MNQHRIPPEPPKANVVRFPGERRLGSGCFGRDREKPWRPCEETLAWTFMRGSGVAYVACAFHARPFRCSIEGCHRAFRTQRGARQHERMCLFDFARPDNPYLPIRRNGRVAGMVLNTPEALASFHKNVGLLVDVGLVPGHDPVRPMKMLVES